MNVSWCIQRGNDVGFKWFNHIMTWALPFLLFVHYHTCIAVTKLGAVKQLTTSESIDAQSAWSPDGTRLAFVSGRSGANEIWVMNPDGTQLERLVACENAGHFASDPCWSPDGKSLIFVSNRAGNMDIWMLDLTTKELVQLTDSPAVDWMPAVSPDGRRIAFVSDRDGQDALWMLDITAGKKLTKLRNGAWDPAWSPDGNRIAFVASADDERGVWIMDLTTRAQVLVLPNGRSPAWSPRGDQL
ncbi:MAG TPA: hypothetical protein EYP10_14960, partial [Armatimonadetes bacterium]|nr:hypothetical protein [Armatimonadota bacterium]